MEAKMRYVIQTPKSSSGKKHKADIFIFASITSIGLITLISNSNPVSSLIEIIL